MKPAPVQLTQCTRNSSFSLTGGFTTEDGPAEGNLNSRYLRKPLKSCDPAAAAKSLQSCPTLCDPTDGSPPGSPIPGILQARTLKWVAMSLSNAWKWKVKVAQSCPTPSDPMDCSLPGSSVHGIFQARVLEWGAIAFSDTTQLQNKELTGPKDAITRELPGSPVIRTWCWAPRFDIWLGKIPHGWQCGEKKKKSNNHLQYCFLRLSVIWPCNSY